METPRIHPSRLEKSNPILVGAPEGTYLPPFVFSALLVVDRPKAGVVLEGVMVLGGLGGCYHACDGVV